MSQLNIAQNEQAKHCGKALDIRKSDSSDPYTKS